MLMWIWDGRLQEAQRLFVALSCVTPLSRVTGVDWITMAVGTMQMPGLAVVTISDRCAAGAQVDTTGPAVARVLQQQWPEETIGRGLVPDNEEAIATLLHELCHNEYELILTAGGTGLGPRDVTPEATRRVIHREVPGLVEAMRSQTATANQLAWLSRAVAGLCGKTLIINLPGSEQGALECLRVILPLLPHALDVVAGGSSHPVPQTTNG